MEIIDEEYDDTDEFIEDFKNKSLHEMLSIIDVFPKDRIDMDMIELDDDKRYYEFLRENEKNGIDYDSETDEEQ